MLDQKGLEIQQKLDELLIKKENFEFDTWPDIHSTLENITSFVESIENEFSEKIENIEANRKNLKSIEKSRFFKKLKTASDDPIFFQSLI